MDELDRFRGFRRDVRSPGEEPRLRASARLADARAGRTRPRSGSRYSAIAAAALAGAAAVTLFVSTPWKSSPGFLARAQAALAPQTGMILHERWAVTTTSADGGCTVARGPDEIWIDETPPYRYRALLNDFPLDPAGTDPRDLVCQKGASTEVGGTADTTETVRFAPPNALTTGGAIQLGVPPDPVSQLRAEIAAGTAHDEGLAELDGRAIERIRLDPPPDCSFCSDRPAYAYVDPETFHPIRTESPHGYLFWPDRPPVRFDGVSRVLIYEYLPRTAANLALTDIRAQHPNASG
jgi:hypothetical protein